ncbi:uncharacterized protein LOC113671228, partial [Pocillopora damicornis]|uniref:uncharacterized protein LOC113671228 n=1 Tax=Pocillopora damicornis TaxID=46731 RepID=UPI000F5536CF
MDWTMKFLPISYRETQCDWFGKKGKPWHITFAISKANSEEIETRTYIHIFDECTQNWFAVASIIEHTLTTLKAFKPNLSQVYLRSDNAGCYHCGYLLLSFLSIGDRTGVKITRYDFSEPQAGKDICNRRVAGLKSHMRRFLNEGNDIKTASDMKTAFESYGGVKGCYAAVCQVQPSAQTMTKHTMTGVQALNNFSYENRGLRMWRAYGIGPGKFYSADQLARFGTPQGPIRLVTTETFSNPNIEVDSYLQRTQMSDPGSSLQLPNLSQTEEESEKLSCQEEGCIKVFQSFAALQKHLNRGGN